MAMARVVAMSRFVTRWSLHGLGLCEINTLSHKALSRAVGVLLAHETVHQCSTQSRSSNLRALGSEPGTGVIARLHRSLSSSSEGSAGASLNQRVLPPSRPRLCASRH